MSVSSHFKKDVFLQGRIVPTKKLKFFSVKDQKRDDKR